MSTIMLNNEYKVLYNCKEYINLDNYFNIVWLMSSIPGNEFVNNKTLHKHTIMTWIAAFSSTISYKWMFVFKQW